MRVKSRVGQVAVVAGSRYDRPRGGLIDERTSRCGRGRGDLYVLAQVTGPAAQCDVVADQLAELIRDIYYEQRGSVTAGLRQALSEANSLLFEENRNSLPGERWAAGVTCALLRGSDLFLAQAGPAAAYLANEGQMARFPDLSPWLDDVPAEEMDAAALGERRELSIGLFHAQMGPGDSVLLASIELARHLSTRRWQAILAEPAVDDVLDALVQVGEEVDLAAVVVALEAEGSEPAAAVQAPAPTAAARAGLSLHSLGAQAVAGARGYVAAAGQVLAAALASLWAALLVLLQRMMPGQSGSPETPKRSDSSVKRPGKAKSGRPQAGRSAARTGSDPLQKILIGVAVAIPLVVAVVVVSTVIRRGQAHRSELEALWQQASSQWVQAQTLTDLNAVRARLSESDALLDQILAIEPDHADALDLKKRIWLLLDEINQVQRVTWIGALRTYDDGADLSRVVVEGTHVFVMDRRGGRVYHHQLDDLQQALLPDSLDRVLVGKGSQVGDVVVGDLVDMVWMPAGGGRQKADLVILESGGALLEYDPTTKVLQPLRLAASDTWRYPELVGSYYGRFYVLDSTANKIWRYGPTADGYSAPPDDWLQTDIDLAGVADMAIGDSIYLLYADGRTRKLTAGSPDQFDISDWDAPPNNPSALFTRTPEDTKWLYVADRGNSRIVQADKDGRFKQQYRLADARVQESGDILAQVTSLFVDEISGHAYLLSGRQLYLIILPD